MTLFGNGGYFAEGDHSGNHTITTSNNITFQSGSGDAMYAQFGNGGHGAGGDHSGDLQIVNATTLTLKGSINPLSYSQIGHGAATDTPNGTCTGHIDIHVSGETSLVNGRSAWLIEHRSTNNTPTNADVTFFTGTLDDDAANIVPATSTLLNADFGTMMSANLAGGNVIIGSTNGDMLVNGAFNYNQPNTLTFLSTSNINFNASVQNSHATAGNINIVSGWDGTSGLTPIAPGSPFVAFAPTDFLAADVNDASMTLFGNNQGSVFIGDGTQTTGNTNVFGYDPAGQRTHRQSRHSVDDALGCH